MARGDPGGAQDRKNNENGFKARRFGCPKGHQNPLKSIKNRSQKSIDFQSRFRRAFWSVLGAEMEAKSPKNNSKTPLGAKTAICGNHLFYSVKALISEVRRFQKLIKIRIILKK